MKPTREEMEQQLLAYVEGTLTPAEAARVEVYLANTDPQLGVQILGMGSDRAALQGLPKLRAPHDLAEQIMEQVERTSLLGTPEREAHRGARRWFQPRYAAAAAVILLAGTFTYVIVDMVKSSDNGWHQPPGGRSDEKMLAVAPKSGGGSSDAMHDGKMAADIGAKAAAGDAAKTSDLGLSMNTPALHAKTDDLAQQVQPLNVTLLARNSGDDARLRTMLASFVAEDELAQREQAATVNERESLTKSAALSGGRLGEDVSGRAQPAAPVTAAPEALQQRDQYQSQQYNQQRAPAPTARLQGPTLEPQATPAPGSRDTAHGYQVPVVAAEQKKEAQATKDADSRVKFTGAPGAPYHLRLRRNQLATLTSQFALAPTGASESAVHRYLDISGSGTISANGPLTLNSAAENLKVGSANAADAGNSIHHPVDSLINNYASNYSNYSNGAPPNTINNSLPANTTNGGNYTFNGKTNGTGTVNLSGGNSYTGGTGVNSGSLTNNNNDALTVSGGVAASAPGPITMGRGSVNTQNADGTAIAPSVPSSLIINNGGSPNPSLNTATTMPAASQVIMDAPTSSTRADHVIKGTAQEGAQVIDRRIDQVAPSDYVDCIITLVPAPVASQGK